MGPPSRCGKEGEVEREDVGKRGWEKLLEAPVSLEGGAVALASPCPLQVPEHGGL